jgi:hypothetical protein
MEIAAKNFISYFFKHLPKLRTVGNPVGTALAL